MSRLINIIFVFATISLVLASCKQTKHVPDGKYLLKKNEIELAKSEVSSSLFHEVIRQKPNYKTFGFKLKLASYNAVDSTKVAEKRIRKNQQLRIKNQRRKAREKRINQRRIARAKHKEKDWYTKKIVKLKDTIDPHMFFREWLKYKFGEPPVVFDSLYFEKSIEQLGIFLKQKGYYFGDVSGKLSYKDNQKVVATYFIRPGHRYYIDSVYLIGTNKLVKDSYKKFIRKNKLQKLEGTPFDSDVLDEYRSNIAGLMRDEALYGFNYLSVDYVVDSNRLGDFVTLGIRFSDRKVQSKEFADSVFTIPYKTYYVKDVYFHLVDTLKLKGKYKMRLNELNLPPYTNGYLTTLDTLKYQKIYYNRSEKKKRGIPVNQDSLNINRVATFYYNGKPFVKPGIIELQNYLENENYYKEYYLERSYSRMNQLDVFSEIKPEIIEIKNTNMLGVHYYLKPREKQYFSFEPKATNSNGFLGVAASVSYSNRNLFRGAELLTITMSGGFESQPPVFDESVDGQKFKKAGRSFNTFEIQPGIKLEIPGIFPFRRATFTAKRQRARTIIGSSFNFQNRSAFNRKSLQFSYLWKFYGGKTQVFQIGFPGISEAKYVLFNPSESFQDKLNELNDLFLYNTYSDQFIWQDWKLTFEYNTTNKENKKSKAVFYYRTSFDPAGNVLSMFKDQLQVNDEGQSMMFGLPYAQFVRIDNEVIYAQPIRKKHSFNWHFLAGAGMPYGNSKTSLPYDYSFFGGGANDNRGWRARALGPGIYKYYLDQDRTATQVGDIRIATSAELRFSLGGYFKAAIFADVGNVWTWKEDLNRPGSKFTVNWYKQLAFSGGVGLRMDFDFFVLRLDLGVPLSNPALPEGSKWIFQSREAFRNEIENMPGLDLSKVPKPFIPVLHFGIGYPF